MVVSVVSFLLSLMIIHLESRPNFIFILTDDQDLVFDSSSVMPSLLSNIRDEGITFSNSFVATPICCPSRTESLTGRYFQNIRSSNDALNTCMHIASKYNVINNTNSMFHMFANNGYITGIFGKMTNDQANYWCNPVKKGQNPYTDGFSRINIPCSQKTYYDLEWFDKYINGSYKIYNLTLDPSSYWTSYIGNNSIQFLQEIVELYPSKPFLLWIGPHAPHANAAPATWYANEFSNKSALRTPNYNIKSYDKIDYISTNPPLDKNHPEAVDQLYRDRLRSLLSVDDIIKDIFNVLNKSPNILDETYFIYTSDHGFHLGQWRVPSGKWLPYDTDIRVPFYIRGPRIKSNVTNNNVIGNIDILPTILSIANISFESNIYDGMDLSPLLFNDNNTDNGWERDIFLSQYISIETVSGGGGAWYPAPNGALYPGISYNGGCCNQQQQAYMVDDETIGSWRALRIMNDTDNIMYVEWIKAPWNDTPEYSDVYHIELYDLNDDIWQIDNIYQNIPNYKQNELHESILKYLHLMAQKCCNISYDVLTILISIADVTTDVIVLIDFYNKERITFFAISLIILILAQCSYSMAFAARFDTFDEWGGVLGCITFCCCLPFGSFVAFCIYLAGEESGFPCFRDFIQYTLGLEEEGFFSPSSTDNNLVKWIKKKLDKHLGFILEAAIEAFPQSLLQIVAIVYYQEANYISIISILLSMFSVMTKSLLLSQGIEQATFVWTWLCVVTDFFGIFFTLTWVFYSHDSIHGNFLGYFNIFGEIWLWKFAISTLLPVALAVIIFFSIGIWITLLAILFDPNFVSHNERKRCGVGCLWILFGPVICILCAFVASLGVEIFCFAILAMAVYGISTERIGYNGRDVVVKTVTAMLNYISNGNKKNRVIRIIAVNYGLNKVCDNYYSDKLIQFIDNTVNEGQYNALKKLTYKDLRKNCNDPYEASLIAPMINFVIQGYKECKKELSNSSGFETFFDYVVFIGYISLAFIFGPILLISKIVQISYPWIIVGYLIYNDLIFTNQIDIFQLVMLAIYIALQLILLFLGIYVFRIHWWLWHIEPGIGWVYWTSTNPQRLIKETTTFYEEVCWYPEVEMIIFNRFGNDIGNIVMDYCKSFQLDTWIPP